MNINEVSLTCDSTAIGFVNMSRLPHSLSGYRPRSCSLDECALYARHVCISIVPWSGESRRLCSETGMLFFPCAQDAHYRVSAVRGREGVPRVCVESLVMLSEERLAARKSRSGGPNACDVSVQVWSKGNT